MRGVLTILVVVVVASWLALFLTSHGLLIRSHVESESDSQKLLWTYFTGVGFVELSYHYGQKIIGGRIVCPRLHDFRYGEFKISN